MKTLIVHLTKYQLRHIISKQGYFYNKWSCIGTLNNENRLQIDEKDNKNWKNWKLL